MPLSTKPQNVSQEVFSAAVRFAETGAIPNQDVVRCRRVWYWSQALYAAAGATSLLFFSSSNNAFTTNWPSNGLANNSIFLQNGLTIRAIPRVTSAGALNANHATNNTGQTVLRQASAQAAAETIESLRVLFAMGRMVHKVNNQEVIDCLGLDCFPQGGGLIANASVDLSTATMETTIACPTNGEPLAGNISSMPRYPVVPGVNISTELQWQSALAIQGTSPSDILFRVAMVGTLFSAVQTA